MHNKSILIAAALAILAFGTFALPLTTTTTAYADNGFTTDCSGPGNSGGDGECSGQSEKSGPHDETVSNRGGNQPPGQQPDEPR